MAGAPQRRFSYRGRPYTARVDETLLATLARLAQGGPRDAPGRGGGEPSDLDPAEFSPARFLTAHAPSAAEGLQLG